MNIVVTREAGHNDSLLTWLPPGATVSEVPLTTTTYYDVDDVRAALEGSRAHGMYRAVVVTSERSADYVEIALRASTLDVEVYCVGSTTSAALVARGVRVHAEGEGPADALARHISRSPVLLLGARVTREELADALRAKGLEVVTIACYETKGASLVAGDALVIGLADVLFIGAPSAWTVARDYVRDSTWVVVPGTSTGTAVRVDHPRVIEGWGPQLRTRLDELSP